MRTHDQNKELHRLLNLTGEVAHKEDLVLGFTSGRSNSSKDLTFDEARAMIHYLKERDTQLHGKSRGLIVHLLTLLNWDINRINNFIKNIGANNPKKKALYNLGGHELNVVTTQVQQLYKKELKNG